MDRARYFRRALLTITATGLAVAFVGAIAQRNPDWLELILPGGRRSGLLWRSLVLCAAVAVADLLLGALIASALWDRGKRRRWLRWLPLAMGVLPPYIQAMAWNDLFQRLPLRIPGDFAAGWVMSMAYLPAGVGIALLSMESTARLPVDAARTGRSDLAVLARVILPLAGPLLAAGAVFIFLLNLMDYSVPSLFGVNVYALEIFAEYSATSQPGRALLLSIPLVVLAAALLPIMRAAARYAAQNPGWGESPWSTQPAWPGRFVLAQRAALGIWAVQAGAPLASLAHLSISGMGNRLPGGDGLFAPAAVDLGFSFGVAILAALLSVPLSWAVMEAAEAGKGLEWLVVLPLALPAPLVGTGMAVLFNRPGLDGLYNSAAMPVLAGLIRFAPLGALAVMAQARRVDPLLFDAGSVFQRGTGQAALRVRLPLLAPGLVAAGCMVFALTLGELGATLIVIPPGYSTLSLRIYNYLHYGASDVVARLCLSVLALTLAAGAGAALALSGWGRRNTRPGTEEP
jgi:iron(III) transport system permease protein